MSKISTRLPLAAALVFAGSFAATVAVRTQAQQSDRPAAMPTPLAQWLHLDTDQSEAVAEHDPQFPDDLAALRDEVAVQRARLVELFENVETPDNDIRHQVDAVIDARNRLERRVADYLVTVRHDLTSAQQQRLFSLCAENVRYCWREQRWREAGAGCNCGRNCRCRQQVQPAGGQGGALDRGPGQSPGHAR